MWRARGGRLKERILSTAHARASIAGGSCVDRVCSAGALPFLTEHAPHRPQPSQKQHEGSVSKRARRKERGKNKGVPEEVCASLGNDLKRLPDTAVLTLLEPTPPPGKGKLSAGGGRVLVANCHLFWNPKRPDIKTVNSPPTPTSKSQIPNSKARPPTVNPIL